MLGLLVCYGYVGMVLFSAYAIRPYGEERSRKFVHVMTANWWLIAIIFFDTVWQPLLVSCSFLFVNIIGERYKLFRQIEVTQRDPGLGTIYYSISMIGLTLLSYGMGNMGIGLVGCLALGYGDGGAALIGQRFPIKKYQVGDNHKSVGGSLAMFVIVACTVGFTQWIAQQPLLWGKVVVIAGVATFLEAIAHRGQDNLWVPLVSGILYGLL